jgi:hypothetical protein
MELWELPEQRQHMRTESSSAAEVSALKTP